MDSISNTVLLSIMSYVLGLVSGFVLSDYLRKQKIELTKNSGNTFVLAIVTTMWAFSLLFDILNPEYTTSPYVHGLMGAIVGFFYRSGGK